MMRVKVLKSFVSERCSASKGDMIDTKDLTGAMLKTLTTYGVLTESEAETKQAEPEQAEPEQAEPKQIVGK